MSPRGTLVVALVVAACSSSGKRVYEPQHVPRVPLRPGYLPFVDEAPMKRRPSIGLAAIAPAADRNVPWPLVELPSLQPHHDYAMARDLCTGAWAQRNKANADLVAYGAAWCRIRAGDRDGVVPLAQLARLAPSDIQRAARQDVINLVAGTDALGAFLRLRELKLDTVENLDTLAATYTALDMPEEAEVVVERVARLAKTATPQERCERLLAWSTLDDSTLARLRELPDDLTGLCAKRAAATACAIDAAAQLLPNLAVVRECYNEFPEDADAERRAWLLLAWVQWPVHTMPFWMALSRDAEKAIGVAGAEDLAVTALENAVRESACEPAELYDIAGAAYRIANLPLHRAHYESRLDELRSMTEKRCSELHE
ncbi:MAG TPA: hypothetical protein VFV99_04580 [Kofleriaceae bacterium]|nr:hypothetical protein [Kofleriaceae bacterium]